MAASISDLDSKEVLSWRNCEAALSTTEFTPPVNANSRAAAGVAVWEKTASVIQSRMLESNIWGYYSLQGIQWRWRRSENV